jgi:glycosyltransferase involved in cell wall biosynthesis
MNLAPIILFVYNRPRHLHRTLESLGKNGLAPQSKLIIYSDGPGRPEDAETVEEVRKMVHRVKGFQRVHIIERNENLGLSKSVVSGVTEVIEKYGKVIVLEDDMECSTNFLAFMNKALDVYREDRRIFRISGYTYPIEIPPTYTKNVFLGYRGSPWGWATWKDRWETIDWEVKDLAEFLKNRHIQKRFNRGGDDLSDMLIRAAQKKTDAWSIICTYAQCKQKAYTLYPTVSKIKNIGYDSSGAHCASLSKWDVELDSGEKDIFLTKEVEVDEEINKMIRKLFKSSLKHKIQRIFTRCL